MFSAFFFTERFPAGFIFPIEQFINIADADVVVVAAKSILYAADRNRFAEIHPGPTVIGIGRVKERERIAVEHGLPGSSGIVEVGAPGVPIIVPLRERFEPGGGTAVRPCC